MLPLKNVMIASIAQYSYLFVKKVLAAKQILQKILLYYAVSCHVKMIIILLSHMKKMKMRSLYFLD